MVSQLRSGQLAVPAHTGRVIDPARFARDRGVANGRFAVAELPRVSQEVFDDQGRVDYRIQGALSDEGEPCLHLNLGVAIAMACQRCTERLPLEFEVERTLLMRRELDEMAPIVDEPEQLDTIPLVAALDLLNLIDEEVMLSLPIAPLHEEGVCGPELNAPSDAAPASPFSVLAQLKGP